MLATVQAFGGCGVKGRSGVASFSHDHLHLHYVRLWYKQDWRHRLQKEMGQTRVRGEGEEARSGGKGTNAGERGTHEAGYVITYTFHFVNVPDTQGRSQDALRRTTFRSPPS